jgi:zinc transporter ZupT
MSVILNSLIVFFSAFGAGYAVLSIPSLNTNIFKTILPFSGAYLFSITILHLIPELYHIEQAHTFTSVFILVGYFAQMLLSNYLLHSKEVKDAERAARSFAVGFMVSLCTHSFFEGALLSHSPAHHQGGEYSFLLAIVLHKIPSAFAMMAIINTKVKSKAFKLAILFFFAVATPLGAVLGVILQSGDVFNSQILQGILAFVAGNFLYIATAILFECDFKSAFNAKKIMMLFVGILSAIVAELFL